jgi:hypothetical protein
MLRLQKFCVDVAGRLLCYPEIIDEILRLVETSDHVHKLAEHR